MEEVKSKTHRCEACGGEMVFDVEVNMLRCTHCDSTKDVLKDAKDIEEHILTLDTARKVKVAEKKTNTVRCNGCGAIMEMDKDKNSSVCAYCGSTYTLAERQEDTLIPDGIIPFNIKEQQLENEFKRWIKKKWLAPGKVKKLYKLGSFQGIYVPYWTFDAKVRCEYNGQGGRKRKVHYKNKDGKDCTRTETDWYSVSGTIENFFDDVQVPASVRFTKGFFSGIEPFDFNGLVPYVPEYLTGYSSEVYSVSLAEGHNEATNKMKKELEKMAKGQITKNYDTSSNVTMSPNFYNETYKYLLVPIYSTAYAYKGTNYKVIINGQSGKIEGDYPKSPVRIILLIMVLVFILWMIVYFNK